MKSENRVFCNQCGKEIRIEQGIVKEGIFSVRYPFGYFSDKDGQVYSFDLCEDCFDRMNAAFSIPCTVEEKTELL